ncbi:VPDSG-CTERM sorting domain-containing protein [Pelagicoccus sp. SDUM812003]|uniref:VPDSG-CTERM sorting domain-containing protein n=1 Tax=Pelagicoccus sp. SDUM812003 TaxID=3041267 RepID=UPI00280E3A1D|nr:VPDSG-CTERM sorting domain-containing protein [Pelagicoccus sp. SDUM812003]MDQ8202398.1 VPDSG-CTERM sorting domain-containing protein [Pelagicoccus sp. SDUM812003]
MKILPKFTAGLAALVAIVSVTPSYALIVSVSGQGDKIAPPSKVLDGEATNRQQQGFEELQNVLLAADLYFTGGVISAGTRVSSHMIFRNRETDSTANSITTATWTFDGDILGIMYDQNGVDEFNSTPILGLVSTVYPSPAYDSRGLESNDSLSVSGKTLEVTMIVDQPGDWIRVVTKAVPDAGATISLLGVSLLALVGIRRRFQS